MRAFLKNPKLYLVIPEMAHKNEPPLSNKIPATKGHKMWRFWQN